VPTADEKNFAVLLVEKDPEALHFVRKSLEQNERFPSLVDHASSIEEALQKLSQNAYHVVLAESQLEEETGLGLLEELQRRKMNLPFVLMTPVRDDRFVRDAIKKGVADLIVKEESQFADLAAKLRTCYKQFHSSSKSSKKNDRRLPSLFDEAIPESKSAAPLSIQDELTGLYNHSHFHDRVVREFSQANRYHYPVSCLMIDMDHFKTVNEEHGYATGEELLKQVAQVLFENCRLSDLICRYGGEEFAVLLPHVNYQGASEVANRIRLTFAEKVFRIEEKEINLTVSIGISSFPEDMMQQRSDLISYAGQALSRSKAAGRNKVMLYKEIMPIFGDAFPDLKISEGKIIEFQRKMSDIFNTARRGYLEASKALIMALENKDRFTAGHAASCAKYCMQVAETLGLGLDEAEIVHHAGLLHDIGKICISDDVLLKPGRLTFAEYETMKQHPYLGYKILKPIKFLQQESILVLHHHEWFNGEGYPCRLKGNEIPLGARIISVIDSYDTMRIAGGRYKKTMTVEAAVNDLIACSGVQFDPVVVKALIDVLKMRGELTTEDYNKERLEQLLANPVPPVVEDKA
jgi:diguanylate cyclase (GGDEF)-like protein